MLSRQEGLPGNIRRDLTLLAAMLVAVLGLVVPQQAGAEPPAAPAVTADGGDLGVTTVGAGNVGESVNYATGNQIWDALPDTYSVKITPGSGSSLPTNTCFDSYLDWKTLSGHWDIRIARTCDTGFPVTQSGNDTNTHRTFLGANRLATCKGPFNATTTGTCSNHSYADSSVAGAADTLGNTYYCARGREVWRGGSGPYYYSGGNSWQCDL